MNKVGFHSRFKRIGTVILPNFSGTRVQMMPIIIGDRRSLPSFLRHYEGAVNRLFEITDYEAHGKVGYLTIDERIVHKGMTLRTPGMHVDGAGHSAGGSGSGPHSAGANGMILVVKPFRSCKAWNQFFEGQPGDNGDCEHLRSQANAGSFLTPEIAYWVEPLCVHESMPMQETVQRQLLRLSMPNNGVWYKSYTHNPLGVVAAGPIIDDERPQMSHQS